MQYELFDLTIIRSGEDYCDVTDLIMKLDDICSSNPCSKSESCVVLSSGHKTCVKECGVDLPLSEADRLANDIQQYYKAGEELVYTCTASDTNVNRRFCLADGLWNQTLTLCSMNCDFEESCPYLEHKGINHFRIGTGATPSSLTGCSSDHTSGNGSYYFLEASYTNQGIPYRMVTSNPFPAGKEICVGLWYHMYGASMGSLWIEIKDQYRYLTSIMVANGSTGMQWHYWSTVIAAQPDDMWISITGVRGPNYLSDMCFDDVAMYLCN